MPVRPATLWLPLVLAAATLTGAAASSAQAPYIPHMPPAPFVPPVIPQIPSAGFQAAQNHAQHDRMLSQQSAMRYQQQQQTASARQGQEWAKSNSNGGGGAQPWAGGGANFAMPQLVPMQPWQHPLQAVDYHSLSTHQKFQYRVAMRRMNRALAAMQR